MKIRRLTLSLLVLTALTGGGIASAGAAGDPSAASPTASAAGQPNSRVTTRIKVVRSRFGRVIADGRGEALYLFTKEKTPRSQCFGDCAYAWPPVLTKDDPIAGQGADADLLGTIRRKGKLQVTYNGHPLYYYVRDRPGLILCQNVFDYGGLWLVVNARGRAIR